MDKYTICPLLMLQSTHSPQCLDKRCAWWDDKWRRCLIAVAALALDNLDAAGIEIYDPAPRDEQE